MDTPAFETLRVEADGALGRLTLARPAKLNPLSTTTLAELATAARWFDARPEVKAVIVSSEGRAFSAGSDLASFAGPQALSPRDGAELGRRMADALEEMAAFAVAAIQGWCVGGGVVLASACDLRIASTDARFSIPEVDLGIPLTWGGIPRLVREIGPARTKELVATCRAFDADEALRIGFVNRVVAPEALAPEAEGLARELAGKARHALHATKRHVNAVTAQSLGLGRSWADADSLVTALSDPECADARRAYLARRAKRR